MGLGKTVQIASFLEALYDNDEVRRVLIIVPLTLKAYWINELEKWTPSAPQIQGLVDKRDEREK
jgi:SNF2 family DNA or RNA helicase